jgi:alcohol dehydrogenase class IV
MSHGIALEGLRLVHRNLLRAYDVPDDLEQIHSKRTRFE